MQSASAQYLLCGSFRHKYTNQFCLWGTVGGMVSGGTL